MPECPVCGDYTPVERGCDFECPNECSEEGVREERAFRRELRRRIRRAHEEEAKRSQR